MPRNRDTLCVYFMPNLGTDIIFHGPHDHWPNVNIAKRLQNNCPLTQKPYCSLAWMKNWQSVVAQSPSNHATPYCKFFVWFWDRQGEQDRPAHIRGDSGHKIPCKVCNSTCRNFIVGIVRGQCYLPVHTNNFPHDPKAQLRDGPNPTLFSIVW